MYLLMILFLIFACVFWVATTGLFKFLLIATQYGQMLGKWQDVITWFFDRGHVNVAKLLGHCHICFAHFISILSYLSFLVFMKGVVGFWLPATGGWAIPANIIWYVVYVAIGWHFSIKEIPKDGV